MAQPALPHPLSELSPNRSNRQRNHTVRAAIQMKNQNVQSRTSPKLLVMSFMVSSFCSWGWRAEVRVLRPNAPREQPGEAFSDARQRVAERSHARSGPSTVRISRRLRRLTNTVNRNVETVMALGNAPVLEALLDINAVSVARTELDAQSLVAIRLAALVAVDAPVQSYLLHFGPAAEAGVTLEDAQEILVAVAPIVGTARTLSAAGKIVEALDLAIDMVLDSEDD